MIPYSVTTAKGEGERVKSTTCEKCQTRFHFIVSRGAAGDHVGLVPTKAGDRAANRVLDRKLEATLSKAVDLVACPNCGWFQSWMIRNKRIKVVSATALTAFVVPWPTLVAIALYYKKLKPKAPTSELMNSVYIAWEVEFAVATLVAITLILMVRPNSGRFFPLSKKHINNGYVE